MVQTTGIAKRLGADTNSRTWTESAMPANDDDTLLPFSLPGICQKKVTAAFDGGLISSDGGVLLLAGADKRLGLVDTLAAIIPDHRDPTKITHTMSDILRARILAIACGAATRTPTIWTICARIRPSNLPVGVCRKAATTWPRNRRCHAGRTLRICAP